jgi:hypothetical protein
MDRTRLTILGILILTGAVIAATFMAARATQASDDTPATMRLLGRIGGTPGPLATVDDEIVLASMGGSIVVFDVSDPHTPEVVGRIQLGEGTINSVHARDGYAIVGTEGMVHVLGLDDPAAPTPLAQVTVDGIAYDVALHGEHAYVLAEDEAGAHVLVHDLTDPATPRPGARVDLDLTEPLQLRSGDGRLAALGWKEHEALVVTIDVADPVRPVVSGQLTVELTDASEALQVDDLVLDGVRGYLAVREWAPTHGGGDNIRERVLVLDLSDPTQPTYVGDVEEPNSCWLAMRRYVAVAGGRLHVLSWCWVETYALQAGKMPEYQRAWEWHRSWESAAGMAATEANVFVASEQARLRVFRAGGGGGILKGTTEYPDPVWPAGIALHDGALLVAGGGLVRYDVTDPAAPVAGASAPHSALYGGDTYVWDPITVDGDVAYVTGWDVSIIDIGNPDEPALLSEIPVEDPAMTTAVHDGRAFVASEESFRVYDVSDPRNPVWLSTDTSFATACGRPGGDLTTDGRRLYLATAHESAVVKAVDVAPDATVHVGGYFLPENPGEMYYEIRPSVTVSAGRVYMTYAGGLSVVDVSHSVQVYDDGTERYGAVWEWTTPVPAMHVDVQWPYVFLTDMHDLHVLDASNPSDIKEVLTYRHGTAELEYGLTFAMSVADGKRVYVSNSQTGVHILEVELPRTPLDAERIYLPSLTKP